MNQRVNLLTPDIGLFEKMLKEYPGTIFDRQVSICKSSAGVRFYLIENLCFSDLSEFLRRVDEDYEIFARGENGFYKVERRIGEEIDLVE